MSRIYISSTYEDLREHRKAVSRSLAGMGHHVVSMENYLGTDNRPLEKALQDVISADVYVGIFAHRYGYVPVGPDNPDQLSITELEWRQAVRNKISCLIFVISPDAPWPSSFMDSVTGEGAGGKRIAALRYELMKSGVVHTFSTPDELATQVMAALANAKPQEFDVFFSYNSKDKEAVRQLAARLQADGIHVWMDETMIEPGDDWAWKTQSAFARADTVVLFVGPSGIGNLQQAEVAAALARKGEGADESFRLIPVLLPKANPDLVPPFVSAYTWLHFRDLDDPDSYGRLKSAIQRRAVSAAGGPSRPKSVVDEQDLQMLPELLFRLVVRLRDRPEMLHSLEATAFWAAVRKIQPGASTIDDLRSVNAQLSSEPTPGALWTAWMRNTRTTELTALLQHPGITQAS
jgi:TIR domain/Domain of unknown function (DUF4062)